MSNAILALIFIHKHLPAFALVSDTIFKHFVKLPTRPITVLTAQQVLGRLLLLLEGKKIRVSIVLLLQSTLILANCLRDILDRIAPDKCDQCAFAKNRQLTDLVLLLMRVVFV